MRRRSLWLLAAVALLALAAWLMSVGGSGPPRRRSDVRFPRGPTELEVQRREARRTLPPRPPVPPPGQPEERRREPVRDPVLLALPPDPSGSAVVIEANALRHSKIGERIVACLLEQNAEDYRRAQEELGIDPLEDVDRVAVSREVVAVSGFFDGLRWDGLEEPGRSYGSATLYDEARVARFGDGLVLMARDREALEAAVDRLDGRAPPPATLPISEEDTYGEVYGTLGSRDLLRLLQGSDPTLAARFEAVAPRLKLHLAADSDVSLVADMEGGDAAAMDDLARTLGGALAMARARAQVEGDADLAEILDLARVQPRGESFGLELALPEALILKQLGKCGDQEP